jgi:ribonuclease HII
MRLVVAGVDEAGRGPLAGPVFAAAVVLDPRRPIPGLADSKQLAPAERERLAVEIRRRARCWSVAWADAEEIDSLNILHASFLAMRRALHGLPLTPSLVQVDGNRLPQVRDLCARCEAVIGGDATVAAISAASILAKTARDALMRTLDRHYPGFQLDEHKGYATERHLRALLERGPSALHRSSFAPVRESALKELENS